MKKKLKKNLAKNIKKRLHKKAWALMSEYKRRLEKGQCFTCGKKLTKSTSNAGHYIHKNCLDYNFMNIHCQCVACNKWKHGNLGVYAEKMIFRYGQEAVEGLRRKAEVIKKFTIGELECIIIDLQKKLEALNGNSN